MKKVLVLLCFFGILGFLGNGSNVGVNAQVNVEDEVIGLSLSEDEIYFSEKDILRMSETGESKYVTIYEITRSGQQRGVANVRFVATARQLTWSITPVTIHPISFTGTIRQSNSTTGLSAGTTNVAGILGSVPTAGGANHSMVAHLSGTIMHRGFPNHFGPMTVVWTNPR